MAVTIEEIMARNPTLEKPVILKCNDGYWTDYMEEIRVFGKIYGHILWGNQVQELSTLHADRDNDHYLINNVLPHYVFIDKPTKPVFIYKELKIDRWMNINSDGTIDHPQLMRILADEIAKDNRVGCYNIKHTIKYPIKLDS